MICSKCNIDKSINEFEVRKDTGNIYNIDYHGEKAQDILKYMYKNTTIYLNRKYERYQNSMKWHH